MSLDTATLAKTSSQNEKVRDYLPGTPETLSLQNKLKELSQDTHDIPLIIGGENTKTEKTAPCFMPHNHNHVLAHYHLPGAKEIQGAIDAALRARTSWQNTPLTERVAIFRRMADLLSGPWRDTINAATMLGQSKNVMQAEIDAACELIDFLRFNADFAEQLHQYQPLISEAPIHNHLEYRSLEGFVLAVTPFNFTSIAANLCLAPVLMGNPVIWAASAHSVYSSYYLTQLFEAAGLPRGVIAFLPGPGALSVPLIQSHPHLSGIHFTGSTSTFQHIWQAVGNNIFAYHDYPRLVGETGGKDFILAHESANTAALSTAIIRGAFEYQGQKCSAVSRVYVSEHTWSELKEDLCEQTATITMGDVEDFSHFMNAVIHEEAFDRITGYIEKAQNHTETTVLCGGGSNKEKGYFIEPTIILTRDPHFASMEEEIFGPVVTIYVYKQSWQDVCELVNNTSPYALTGAVFAEDKQAIEQATQWLRFAAGNFYINDKPTGAVVGQQPFGGARQSGTNDKAGALFNLLRWTSVRTIKENKKPASDYRYPFMQKDK